MDEKKKPCDEWLSDWEKQAIAEWEAAEANLSASAELEQQEVAARLWQSFQSSASSVSDLYRERTEGGAHQLWIPFQTSASRVTLLYKDSVESTQRAAKTGQAAGKTRQTKDVLGWARKKRPTIRRDELIAFLCGKTSPPPPPPASGRGRAAAPSFTVRRAAPPERLPSPRFPSPRAAVSALDLHNAHGSEDSDLRAFRDPFSIQRLTPEPPITENSDPAASQADAFHELLLEEASRRNNKRSPPRDGGGMDWSPGRKRGRFL